MDFGNEQNSSPCSSSSPSWSSSSPPRPSHAQHSQKRRTGRKKFKETRHPVYRGVRQRYGDRWVCEVREPDKKTRIWLGTYPTPEMAAVAHDVAVLTLRGSSALFNFPHSVPLLPRASSSSPADIRQAASKAARDLTPITNINNSNPSCSSSLPSLATDDTCLKEENIGDDVARSMFFDEEAVYNMPGLLDSMAEGLIITPPSTKRAFNWDHVDETEVTLWTT